MTRRIHLYAVSFLLMYSAPSQAQDTQGIVPLAKGTPAPFSGLLYPESAVDRALKDSIELDAARAKAKALEGYVAEQDRIYKAALEQASAGSWYESPELNRWVGIVIGAGLTLLVVSAVSPALQK